MHTSTFPVCLVSLAQHVADPVRRVERLHPSISRDIQPHEVNHRGGPGFEFRPKTWLASNVLANDFFAGWGLYANNMRELKEVLDQHEVDVILLSDSSARKEVTSARDTGGEESHDVEDSGNGDEEAPLTSRSNHHIVWDNPSDALLYDIIPEDSPDSGCTAPPKATVTIVNRNIPEDSGSTTPQPSSPSSDTPPPSTCSPSLQPQESPAIVASMERRKQAHEMMARAEASIARWRECEKENAGLKAKILELERENRVLREENEELSALLEKNLAMFGDP